MNKTYAIETLEMEISRLRQITADLRDLPKNASKSKREQNEFCAKMTEEKATAIEMALEALKRS